MELMKNLNEKLIAELIPEVGPRIIFITYWKTNFLKNQEPSTSSDTDTTVGYINKCSIHTAVLFGFLSEINDLNKINFVKSNI